MIRWREESRAEPESEWRAEHNAAARLQRMKQEAAPIGPECWAKIEPTIPTQMMDLPGGTFLMGSGSAADTTGESPQHACTIGPFRLDRLPVTSAQWAHFILQQGYSRQELWNAEGWNWRSLHGILLPEYWLQEGDRFAHYTLSGPAPIPSNQPVYGISWYEAVAYAHWAGKRLPTEQEWEFAASIDPVSGEKRRYPWGDTPPTESLASFGLHTDHPVSMGRLNRDGGSALELMDMAGSVWEWTASSFHPYPDVVEEIRISVAIDPVETNLAVCRGGSFASSATLLRSTLRYPLPKQTREAFVGLRCAL